MQHKIKGSVEKLREWYEWKQLERSIPNPLKIVRGGSGNYVRIVKWRQLNNQLSDLLEEEGILWDPSFCEKARVYKECEKECANNHITLTMLNYLILSNTESQPIIVRYVGKMEHFSDGTKLISRPAVKVLNKRDTHRVMKKIFR